MRNLIYTLLFLPCCVFAKADVIWKSKEIRLVVPPAETSIEFAFEFSIAPDTRLIIKEVKASCGCTVLQPEKMTYRAGETGRLAGSYSAHGRKGQQKSTVSVFYDLETGGQVNSGHVNLTLNVDIPNYLEISPAILIWDIESKLPKVIRVSGLPDHVKNINLIAVNNEYFNSEWTVGPTNLTYSLELKPKKKEAFTSVAVFEAEMADGNKIRHYAHLLAR